MADQSTTGVPIELRKVTKAFPGGGEPAVRELDLNIPAGEIVVLVGPSGCGKTTTMRMINRLIEPTSGDIVIDGRSSHDIDPDRLRRNIGYVIQQAGLFPHMTVAANIAQVPRMLGWDRARIAERVDELLTLVGLDPQVYRDTFPRRLSGGQQQRVGVARALAADPPVLLMDEPFGALDPISRERLQDELLGLQDDLAKTIVFVTHDIDEALKIGDHIAIMKAPGHIVQYATPAEILTNPADDYVEQFLGAGSSMRLLRLTKVGDIEVDQVPYTSEDADAAEVLAEIERDGRGYALITDGMRRPLRWVGAEHLQGIEGPVGSAGDPITGTLGHRMTLQDALEALLNADTDVVPVVGRRRAYAGALSLSTVQNAIQAIKTRERERRLHRNEPGAGG
ncbi:betaine/proline/choline family ABC transporter ATP-binding protein [Nonomuraea diastatica]|uniref:ABC-type quaternary amine transporter n=1 Tax=Nonomuraea diastatica TaxID=1848329 RepID=A0A4R4WML9_9ACTN|nr:betaine/proline/choline family ABC transporter ATP-binding protein [Nonomuraea diastatica]TDD15040.1 ATP-binding cassette domain-containing protein [Nonomuraea diastatica]